MTPIDDGLKADLNNVARIPFLPALLEVVCIATGLGFAAIARVTQDRWIACAVKDDIQFGLMPGGELPVATTICHEIRQHNDPVIIDHVSHNAQYSTHPTPAMYGFESYISYPIVRSDGSVFGTLCAIDPRPARLNRPHITALFAVFARLIAFYLDCLQTFSSANLNKLQEYAAAEIERTRRDIGSGDRESTPEEEERHIRQLAMKLDMLLLTLAPNGTFIS